MYTSQNTIHTARKYCVRIRVNGAYHFKMKGYAASYASHLQWAVVSGACQITSDCYVSAFTSGIIT